VLGAVGTVVGAVIRANRPGERWRSVDVPGRVSLAVGRSGVGLGVSFRP
jgi:hypothetical protein